MLITQRHTISSTLTHERARLRIKATLHLIPIVFRERLLLYDMRLEVGLQPWFTTVNLAIGQTVKNSTLSDYSTDIETKA